MSPCKFTYFNSQALGEPIRLLLHYGKIEFDDIRVDFANDWPTFPKDTLPLGQLPILEIDGKKLYQSISICRYLAKKVGLVGVDAAEDYEIDSAVDNLNDLRTRIAAAFYEQNAEAKGEKLKIVKNETIPFLINKFEAIAEKNDGHFALKRFTWADVYFTGIINYLNVMAETDLTENHPNLRKVIKNTESTAGIKQWIEKRPKTFY